MQHHQLRALLAILLFWLMPLGALCQSDGSPEPDTAMRRHIRSGEEDQDRHRRRDAWIESLHRCEPGLNWRAIDRENRRAIGVVRSMALAKRASRGMQGVPDTIPGVISGTWVERGSRNQAGRILHADVDLERGLIYAASDGGTIWRGTLEGREWRSLNDTLRMPDLTMLKVIPRPEGTRLLAMTGNSMALYLSDDDGLSWHRRSKGLETFADFGSSKKGVVVNDSSHSIYLLGMEFNRAISQSSSTLYRSTDGGDSFTHLFFPESDLPHLDLWTPQAGGSDLLMLHRDTVSRILPDGTREVLGRVPFVSPVHQVYLNGTLAGGRMYLYASMRRGNAVFWYRSSDTARTWSSAGSTLQPFSLNSIAVSTVDPASVFTGDVNCYRSGDSAARFSAVSSWTEYDRNPKHRLHADIFGIHPFRDRDGSEFILICTDGGIYISRDTLRSVLNLSLDGLNVSQYYSTFTNQMGPMICNAGSQDQGFQRAVVTGTEPLEFKQVEGGDYGSLASSDSGENIWANYPGFTLLVMGNEKGELLRMRTAEFRGRPQQWIPPLVADPSQPLTAYMPATDESGEGSFLWRLQGDAAGIRSTRLPFNFATGAYKGKITAFGISPLESWCWYAITEDGRFFRSQDIGDSWEMLTDSMFAAPYSQASVILPSSIDPNTLYVAGSGYSMTAVKVSTDRGRTFTPIVEGLPKTLVYDLAADPQERHLFAATEVGPFVYSMEHKRWYYLGGANAPEQVYMAVEYIPATRTARFATYGRGIWDFVADQGASADPSEAPAPLPPVALAPVPNPATSQATLVVTMPRAGHATIRVYDLAGREVAVLADRHLEAGVHSLPWDLRSQGGASLSSGSYTCVISSGGSIGFARLEVLR